MKPEYDEAKEFSRKACFHNICENLREYERKGERAFDRIVFRKAERKRKFSKRKKKVLTQCGQEGYNGFKIL